MRFASFALASAITLLAPLVLAGTSDDGAPRTRTDERRTTEERPFVHVVDPSVPSAGVVTGEYTVGYGSGVAALRPLPSTTGVRSVDNALTVGAGLGYGLAPFVTGVMGFGDGAARGAGVVGGMRWSIPTGDSAFRAGLVGAGFREPGGTFGAYVRGIASYDVGRFRAATNVHVERVFASGRDGVDVIATLGASYQVLPGFRVGAEYVGQDLEGAVERDEAEGGAKHYAGPTLALDLDRGRAQIVAGPAFGLGGHAAPLLGRASVVISF
jgi:hypothetical protein